MCLVCNHSNIIIIRCTAECNVHVHVVRYVDFILYLPYYVTPRSILNTYPVVKLEVLEHCVMTLLGVSS